MLARIETTKDHLVTLLEFDERQMEPLALDGPLHGALGAPAHVLGAHAGVVPANGGLTTSERQYNIVPRLQREFCTSKKSL